MFQENAAQWRHKWYITTALTAWAGTPYALCCWMIPCYVSVRLCALVCCIHGLFSTFILSWSAGPLQGLTAHDNLTMICYWLKRASIYKHLPITLPWRQVGSVVVMAGVRHSDARRKLCVNTGAERCQWPGGNGVRDCVGNCEGESYEWKSLPGSKEHLEVCWSAQQYIQGLLCICLCLHCYVVPCATVRSAECSVKEAICV